MRPGLTALGIDQRLPGRQRDRAVSRFFDPMEGLGNYHALHLGSARGDVLENLGVPEGDPKADE